MSYFSDYILKTLPPMDYSFWNMVADVLCYKYISMFNMWSKIYVHFFSDTFENSNKFFFVFTFQQSMHLRPITHITIKPLQMHAPKSHVSKMVQFICICCSICAKKINSFSSVMLEQSLPEWAQYWGSHYHHTAQCPEG